MTTAPVSGRPAYDPWAEYEVDEHDVEYRRDGQESWLARVYRPRGNGPFPTLVEVHGGAWNGGDRVQNASIDRALAASGLVVVAIDFRLAGQAPYPASLQDVNYATRWLKAHAAELGGTAQQLGGLGFSSGGHMLMLSALRPTDPRHLALPLAEAPDLDATLSYAAVGWPVLDPYARYLHARNVGRDDLIAATERYFIDEAGLRDANPQLIVERGEAEELPPTLIVAGATDRQISPRTAENFATAYSQAGGVIEIAVYPGVGHGFGREPGLNTDRALALIKGFIARRLAEG
jgi:acetyl esterase